MVKGERERETEWEEGGRETDKQEGGGKMQEGRETKGRVDVKL